MPRLFIAIDLPETVKAQLGTLKTPIPSAQWVKPETMHLTLRFLGDTDGERVPMIRSALAGINAEAFDLTMQRVGRFPPSHKKAPRVLWAGVKPEPRLDALHAQVEAALETVGYTPEKRPFNPHITLARLRTHKPTPEADAFLEAHQAFVLPAFPVEMIHLVSSRLTPQGPIYTYLDAYPLTPETKS